VTTVHVVVPEGIDDTALPSGGNAYDRHLCGGLTSIGWAVHEHAVAGSWPQPDAQALAGLDDTIRRLPDDAVVLLDGLVASTAPEVMVPQAHRLHLVVLVHMPLGHRPKDDSTGVTRTRERAVLSAAAAVVTTSAWTRQRLLELYGLPPGRMHVAEPATEAADLATGTATGEALLCVAAVTREKGHDVLLDALASATDISWQCVCVGSLERDPALVEALRRRSLEGGLGERVSFPGPRTGADLDRTYAAADLVLLASRAEAYGMVVIEALARGLPVIATDVGGLPDALGHGADGTRPGLLVPPDDAGAFGAAVRAWLGDAELRQRLRRAARERRQTVSEWSSTTSAIARVLAAAR
jgi:glycosyltransferase involved in cell wall biosynthesis